MNFKRAITKEQRDVRRAKISEEAVRLLNTSGFESVTFHKISSNIGYNRTILYSLYETPCDILIECLSNRCEEIYNQVIESSNDQINPIHQLVGVMDLDANLKSLIAIYGGLIEPNASIGSITKFRTVIKGCKEKYCELVLTYYPELTEDDIHKYHDALYILYTGLVNLNTTDPKLVKVNKSIKMDLHNHSFAKVWLRVFAARFESESGQAYLNQVDKVVQKEQFNIK